MPADGGLQEPGCGDDPRRIGGGLLFASYNIHKCVGVDGRFDPGRTARVIGELGADVLALQETDRRHGARGGLLDLAAIELETGLVPVPVRGRRRSHGWHGNLLLVRSGLVKDLHQIALPGLEPRGALVADLDLEPGPVRVIAAHLGLLRRSRLLQVQSLIDHASHIAERPTVLMGDLNEWRRHRRSALSHFAPRFGPVGSGVASFPAYFPVLALDRIFARPHYILGAVAAHASPLARVASDHLPITGRVQLASAADNFPEERPPWAETAAS